MTFLLEFMRLSIDRFEKTIETTRMKEKSVQYPRQQFELLHSEIGEKMWFKFHDLMLKEIFRCFHIKAAFIDRLNRRKKHARMHDHRRVVLL